MVFVCGRVWGKVRATKIPIMVFKTRFTVLYVVVFVNKSAPPSPQHSSRQHAASESALVIKLYVQPTPNRRAVDVVVSATLSGGRPSKAMSPRLAASQG